MKNINKMRRALESMNLSNEVLLHNNNGISRMNHLEHLQNGKIQLIRRLHSNISDEDVNEFLRKKKLPNYPHLEDELKKLREFENLDPMIQKLILALYENSENYAKSGQRNIMEEILIDYDFQMGELSSERKGAKTAAMLMGMKIPPDVDPDVFFINKLMLYIETSNSQTPSKIESRSNLGIRDIVEMTPNEFKIFLLMNKITNVEYHERLDYVMNHYYNLT